MNTVKGVLAGRLSDRKQMGRNVWTTRRIHPVHLQSQHDPCSGEAADRNRPREKDKLSRLFDGPFGHPEADGAEVCNEVLAPHVKKQALDRERQ